MIVTSPRPPWTLRPRSFTNMTVYPEGGYVRTLHLLPGSGDEPLRCSLETSLMSDADYEAISYVWGSDIKDHEIVCDGRTVPITTNLWIVLRHIRLMFPCVLWADSICINQDNLEEKNHQVAMMGQVYRSAQRVLIFLGEDDHGMGPQVQSLTRDMNTMITTTLQQCGTGDDSFPYLEDNAPILLDERWRSLGHMLDLGWFSRGWVSPCHIY